MNKGSNRYIDGRNNEPLYYVYYAMFSRCTVPTNKDYADYGARGITICIEWNTYEKFRFWALSNGYKLGLTLERLNNLQGYFPSNCKWVTRLHQANNRRVRKGTDPKMVGITRTKAGKFYAYYCILGKRTHIGTFLTLEDAQKARDNANSIKLKTYENL